MFRGWQVQDMSGTSGLSRDGGKKRGPGGNGTESDQDPSGWHLETAVTGEPSSFLHEGHEV